MPRAGEDISEWLLEPASSIQTKKRPIKEDLPKSKNRCRDMRACFTDGQKIRHKGRNCTTWIGTYNASLNRIRFRVDTSCGRFYGMYFKSPSGFAEAHYHDSPHSTRRTANGWKECEVWVAGTWTSIDVVSQNVSNPPQVEEEPEQVEEEPEQVDVPAPLEEEAEENDEIDVEEITINGKSYFKADDGTIYDPDTQEVVGQNGKLFE